MDMMISLLTSKTFLTILALLVVYNMVRRYNKQAQRRSSRAQRRLKDRIRNRQETMWDRDEQDPEAKQE